MYALGVTVWNTKAPENRPPTVGAMPDEKQRAIMNDSDECDKRLTKVRRAPALSEGQQRFLDAYRQRLAISAAARLANVHRTSVYRWLKDEAFAAALKEAADDFFRQHKARALAAEAVREEWRRQRERERRPMRCYHLARARAIKLGLALPPLPDY
jgi:hypothetical protein